MSETHVHTFAKMLWEKLEKAWEMTERGMTEKQAIDKKKYEEQVRFSLASLIRDGHMKDMKVGDPLFEERVQRQLDAYQGDKQKVAAAKKRATAQEKKDAGTSLNDHEVRIRRALREAKYAGHHNLTDKEIDQVVELQLKSHQDAAALAAAQKTARKINQQSAAKRTPEQARTHGNAKELMRQAEGIADYTGESIAEVHAKLQRKQAERPKGPDVTGGESLNIKTVTRSKNSPGDEIGSAKNPDWKPTQGPHQFPTHNLRTVPKTRKYGASNPNSDRQDASVSEHSIHDSDGRKVGSVKVHHHIDANRNDKGVVKEPDITDMKLTGYEHLSDDEKKLKTLQIRSELQNHLKSKDFKQEVRNNKNQSLKIPEAPAATFDPGATPEQKIAEIESRKADEIELTSDRIAAKQGADTSNVTPTAPMEPSPDPMWDKGDKSMAHIASKDATKVLPDEAKQKPRGYTVGGDDSEYTKDLLHLMLLKQKFTKAREHSAIDAHIEKLKEKHGKGPARVTGREFAEISPAPIHPDNLAEQHDKYLTTDIARTPGQPKDTVAPVTFESTTPEKIPAYQPVAPKSSTRLTDKQVAAQKQNPQPAPEAPKKVEPMSPTLRQQVVQNAKEQIQANPDQVNAGLDAIRNRSGSKTEV